MKEKYKRKIWLNWWHLIIIVLGLLGWFFIVGATTCINAIKDDNGVIYQPTFFGCLIYSLNQPIFWLYAIIGLAILYLIITLISWLYYKNKR